MRRRKRINRESDLEPVRNWEATRVANSYPSGRAGSFVWNPMTKTTVPLELSVEQLALFEEAAKSINVTAGELVLALACWAATCGLDNDDAVDELTPYLWQYVAQGKAPTIDRAWARGIKWPREHVARPYRRRNTEPEVAHA